LDIEGYTIWINGRDPVGVIDHTPGMLRFILEGHEQTAWYSVLPDNTMILTWQGFNFKVTDPAFTRKLGADGSPETGNGQSTGSRVSAPLPGRIARLLVKPGDAVTKGTSLAVIESMKTENQILALTDGVVGNIVVKEGQQVKSNDLIMDLNTN
jgi:biotin carboxyl carrier protein